MCLRSDSHGLFGGAPPAGTCVAACSACDRFADGKCVAMGDGESARLCLEGCSLGAGSSKCHDRSDVACAPVDEVAGGSAYCRPLCTTGKDCPSGACDPSRGVCVDHPVPDETVGRDCEQDADAGVSPDGPSNEASEAGADDVGTDGGPTPGDATRDGTADARPEAFAVLGVSGAPVCDGLCVSLQATASLCSHRCVFGQTGECAEERSGKRTSGCLFPTKGGSLGDLGYCSKLCDCSDDCGNPSMVCDALDDAGLESAFGRKGVCTSRQLVLKRPLECAR